MTPDKLDEVSQALDSEMAEIQARSPRVSQRDDKLELGWLARRGRRLHMAIEGRRGGPVLVLSIWSETEFGETFPVRDGQVELGATQLPIFGSLVAKAIRVVRDRAGERLAVRVGGAR